MRCRIVLFVLGLKENWQIQEPEKNYILQAVSLKMLGGGGVVRHNINLLEALLIAQNTNQHMLNTLVTKC